MDHFGPLRSRSRAATLGPFGGCRRMTHRRCGVEETQLAHNWPVRRVRGHAHLFRWRRLMLNKCFKMFRSMTVCTSSSNKSQIYTHELWVMKVSTDVSPTVFIITLTACMPWVAPLRELKDLSNYLQAYLTQYYNITLLFTVVCLKKKY